MKYRLTAPALLMALAAPHFGVLAQSTNSDTLSLYGSANAAVVYKTNQTGGGSATGVGNSPFRPTQIGFRGSEDLGGGMRAMFRFESGIAIDTGMPVNATKYFNRESTIGLAFTPWATLSLGRQLHASSERVAHSLDVYHVAGALFDVTPLVAFGVNKFAQNDTRADDSIKLRLRGPAGLNLGLSAALKNNSGTSQSFDIAQITPQYTIAAWAVRFKAADTAANGITPEHTAYGLGGNVPIGAVRLYAHYVIAKSDPSKIGQIETSNKILHLGATWAVTPQVTLKAAAYHDKGKSINNVTGRDGSKNTYVISGDYAFSKRTSLNLGLFTNQFTHGYKLDPVNIAALGRNPGSASTSGVSLGLSHSF